MLDIHLTGNDVMGEPDVCQIDEPAALPRHPQGLPGPWDYTDHSWYFKTERQPVVSPFIGCMLGSRR